MRIADFAEISGSGKESARAGVQREKSREAVRRGRRKNFRIIFYRPGLFLKDMPVQEKLMNGMGKRQWQQRIKKVAGNVALARIDRFVV